MRSLWSKLFWVALLATLLTALALGAFLVWGLPELLPAATTIVVDGQRFELADLRPAHPGHWLMASMGLVVAAAVIVVVVPLVVLLALAVPLLLGAFGVALALLVLGLVMSPLVLLVWWLWKDRKPKTITMSS